MPEPVTISLTALAIGQFLGESIVGEVIGGEAHGLYRDFLERWRDAAIDPETGLPRNHDLQKASLASLREAALVLVAELAGRLDGKKPWLPCLFEHVRAGNLFKIPLLEAGADPKRQWVEALRAAISADRFASMHAKLLLNEDDVRQCFSGGNLCAAIQPKLAQSFIEWAEAEVQEGSEPAEAETPGRQPANFRKLVTEGWQAAERRGKAITLAHVYCLFFREHLKTNPKVFRILVTDTLTAMGAKLDGLGANLTGELKTLRELIATLIATPSKIEFTAFEQWLEPQLGEIKSLLAGMNDMLDAMARGQEVLRHQQGEILVAITTLQMEFARNNRTAAQPALDQFRSYIEPLSHKLDYLIGGLPIQRFRLPPPPERELDLLQAKHRTVDLLGRTLDLDALTQWLEADDPISARLLVGGAGTGKTRLAYELLLRVNVEKYEWQSGVLNGSDLRRLVDKTHTPDFNWAVPTLLVVDYAQTLAAPLRDLLVALTHKSCDRVPKLRLLLLERQPGDWFDDLLRAEESHGPCAVRALFNPPAPVPLTPLPQGKVRRQILQQTLKRAAEINRIKPLALPPEEDRAFNESLNHDLFSQPLNLMLAALAASELGLLPALRRERIALAETLAERELRRVERFARDPQSEAQKRALRHLAACATMERGFTSTELDRAMKEELDALRIVWPDGAGDAAMVLRRALPHERLAVAPVEPDFLGEALVLLTLAKADRNAAERRQNWCAIAERCCRRDPLSTPATLLHAFQNFGHDPRYGEPLLAATDALIRAGLADAEPALLLGIESALPHETVELRGRAAQVTWHLYERLKSALEKGRDDLSPEVARLASNLGVRLSDAGRRTEALGPAQEAVEIHRALARQNADAFQPALASSLNNLAIRLSELGRRAEALGPAQEAVELNRALARQNADAFQQTLAMSLNNLANVLSELGRRAEALGPAQEAVEILRALARQNLETFQRDLASSLNNMAIRLNQLGRRTEALGSAQEAVEIYRALARQNPDAFQPALASSLNNLAIRLSALGRRAEALGPAQEAVEIRRALARQNPEAFQPALAMSLNNLATFLSELGRRAEALGPAQEAVELYRALARQNPDAFQPAWASSLNNLATFLSELGRRAEALVPAQEAVELYRALARQNPDAFQPDLAMSLNNLANRLSELGRRAEALGPAQEALELYRALARQNPDAFQSDLASSLNTLANVLSELGRLAEALGPAQEAVEIRRALARQNPDAFSHDLAISLGAFSQVLTGMERHAEAAAALAEALRALRPQFLALPEAFAPLIVALVRDYLSATEAAQAEPDLKLLAPILERLEQMQPTREGGSQPPG
ncbi:MAG: tetratricopeptide repeat protein [Verrucomicrobiota bacterium]